MDVWGLFILFIYFLINLYFYLILLYNTVLVLPYIDMNPPQVYMGLIYFRCLLYS